METTWNFIKEEKRMNKAEYILEFINSDLVYKHLIDDWILFEKAEEVKNGN
jgi:hypothetical protein